MIEHQLVLIIALILAICVLIMVSQRIKVAYPIMLVLGGVAMSFIPGMPRFNINPDLIFGLMVKCTPERGQKCSLFHLMVKCTPIIVELPSVYRGCKPLICFQ